MAILCIMILVVLLSVCGNEEKDYSNQTVMGKAVSANGDSITLQIAAMNVSEGMEDDSGNMTQGRNSKLLL